MSTQPDAPNSNRTARSWHSLWHVVTRIEREKITPWIALRNTVGVATPLIVGAALGAVTAGLAVSAGALNVSFSDNEDPYRPRARRMLTASFLVGIAVFVGALSDRNTLLAVSVAALWAFAAGMMVSVGAAAADIGTISLVTLVVFAAHPMQPERAALSGLLAFGGGLLQTALALALWPVRRYEPQRRALANLYRELSRAAAARVSATEAPPGTSQSTLAQSALTAINHDLTIEGERYRMLFHEAERIRLSLLTLHRLCTRIARESDANEHSTELNRAFDISSGLLKEIGASLTAEAATIGGDEPLREISALAEKLRYAGSHTHDVSTMLADARAMVDRLAGQLRAAFDLAAKTTTIGSAQFREREAQRPWSLRLGNAMATLRANLTFESAACRHAVRLAACVAVGNALGRTLGLQRPYWIPMTIAIVLKPDFTATFSRGLLRLFGTMAGLAFATGLFHVLPRSRATEIALIAILTFMLRSFGPANYGIFVAAISALVVALVAVTGVAPQQVIAARAVNTMVGGALALVAYAIWPTWERTHVSEALARMLDAYRDYFRTVSQGYLSQAASSSIDLDRVRHASRLARSNAETSVHRVSAEPGGTHPSLGTLTAILASSHRLVHAVMALEAGLTQSPAVPARTAFQKMAHDVEFTLYFLAAALRGLPLSSTGLPDLREDHHTLIHSGGKNVNRYMLTNMEMDRVTDSLNTLREQILDWTQNPISPKAVLIE